MKKLYGFSFSFSNTVRASFSPTLLVQLGGDIMKKIRSLAFRVCVAFFVCLNILLNIKACRVTGSLMDFRIRSKLLTYYADDTNYDLLEGEVVDISPYNDYELEIRVFSPQGDEYVRLFTANPMFCFYTNLDVRAKLSVGDAIVFSSAPAYEFHLHLPPVVSLERDGEVLLSFEEGKKQLLQYVETEMFPRASFFVQLKEE